MCFGAYWQLRCAWAFLGCTCKRIFWSRLPIRYGLVFKSSQVTAKLPTNLNPPHLGHIHGGDTPSEWVQKWTHLLPKKARVLDLACGQGRHMRYLQGLGHQVTGVDRSPQALEIAAAHGHTVWADIETGPWPFADDGNFDAVVVTNYLWRPLFASIFKSLAAGGVLIYETFTIGQETLGKPSNPDFLLQTGELLQVFSGLRVVAFEDGFLDGPDRFVQRLAAVKPHGVSTSGLPARYSL